MTVKKSLVVFALLVLALPLGIALADSAEKTAGEPALDWPQWRGPNRDAVSTETGLLEQWPEGGPRVLWRIPVGAGYSGVSVSEGKLYTLWDEKGKQYLFGLDASTGKELWRQELGAAFTSHIRRRPSVHAACRPGRRIHDRNAGTAAGGEQGHGRTAVAARPGAGLCIGSALVRLLVVSAGDG